MLIVVIPILASVMLNKAGGMTAILLQSKSNKLSFFNQADYLNYIILFFALSMPTHHLNPSLIQRYLAAINPKDIQSIMYTYCFIKSALIFTLAIIALSGLIIYPNILPHHLLNIAIINLLPSIVKGLTIAGIFAVIMSTADSNINSAAILLSHNCIFKIHSSFNELKLAKIATFISGIIGISIGLLNLNIIRVIMDLELIWGIMVGIPMIIGILRLSRPLNFFWYCCVITCITMFLNYYLKVEICISTLIVSLLISLMILVYNLWCNSGFRLRLNKNITSKKQHIIKSQYNITQFIHFIKNKMEENSINVKVYGTFCCINYIVPWFM
ncbi:MULTISPECIES: hypothetical protein [unclassified Candidatus Tisiphia]|uniref:hypothetical protein n=1 Tax=unclassified Candidatus Tisiphia TaxID=2996318 RepID=UPI00313E22DF